MATQLLSGAKELAASEWSQRENSVLISEKDCKSPFGLSLSLFQQRDSVFPLCLSLCLTLFSQMPLLHRWTACMWQFSNDPGYSKQIQPSPIHTCGGTCSSLLVTDGTTLMLHTFSRTHITVVEDQTISTVQEEIGKKSVKNHYILSFSPQLLSSLTWFHHMPNSSWSTVFLFSHSSSIILLPSWMTFHAYFSFTATVTVIQKS